jgi:hypothetical protein
MQNNTDYKFHITTDNKPNTSYEEINSNSNHRTLKIEVNDDDRIILIGGSKIDTGRTAIINCSDIIFSSIILNEKENEGKSVENNIAPTITKEEKENQQSVVNKTINKPEDFRDFFPLKVNGKNYTIETNSTNKNPVKEITFYNNAYVNQNVEVDRLNGKLQIKIPRELFDSTEDEKDIPFEVFVDKFATITPDEVETNSQSRTISIPITNETNTITIIGKKETKTISNNISVNVNLDTQRFTIFDQDVVVKIYNSNGPIDSSSLTVPNTGGATTTFTVEESLMPAGNYFSVCVYNDGKESCRQTFRGNDMYNLDVYLIVP